MKVLHCITGLGYGGAQVMLYRYLRGLGRSAENHEVISLLPSAYFSGEIEKLGVRVNSVNLPLGRVTFSGLQKIRAHIREFNPDIIHGWMYHGNVAASIANYRLGPTGRVVWSVHHSLHDLSSESRNTRLLLKLSKPMSRRVGAITYCSHQSQKQHEALGYDESKCKIIPNGTDLTEYKPRDSAKSFLCTVGNIPKTRIHLGNINRNHPMKDQLSLVRASHILIQQGWDIHLILIGEGHENSKAHNEAKALGMQERFTIIPARNDIPKIVPGLDVFVLSSAWGEAFPLSVGEAMASEVPAVVTRIGDCDWLVGDAGEVVEPSNPQALASGIEVILNMSKSQRSALGKKARKRIEDLFSLDKYIDEHAALYDQVLQKPK